MSCFARQLYDAWANVSTFNVTFRGESFNFSGSCALLNGVCMKETILAFYDYNRSRIAELDDAELWQVMVDANYTATEQDGRAIDLSTVALYSSSDGTVTSIRFTMLQEQKEDTDGDRDSDKAVEWELQMSDLIRGRAWGSLSLTTETFGELEREASFANDLQLLPIGFILLVAYVHNVHCVRSLWIQTLCCWLVHARF